MEKVTKNVFAETEYVGCNSSYIITEEGIVVIDPPQLPSRAIVMREEVLAKKPVKYLINIEHHPDHVFGNYYFNNLGIVVAHENVLKKFMFAPGIDSYEKCKNEAKEFDPEGVKHFPRNDREYWANCNKPTITFKDKMTISLGKHEFQLYYLGGHSIGQICLYCPQEKVIFTADNIYSGVQIWFAEADPWDIIRALDFINTFDFNYIVPGHGDICKREEIEVNKSFILEWLSAVQLGIANGWSKEKCIEEISFEDKYPIDVGLESMHKQLQEWNVSKLYDYLLNKGRIKGYEIYP